MSGVSRNWPGLVDRRQFIPDTIWTFGEDGWRVPVRRQDDPAGWEALVASDDPVVTEVEFFRCEDGALRAFHATSSSSAPWLMSRMLDALDLMPGMAVLEIGTGTGWNAALMAAAGAVVTTVEIDGDLAEHARKALDRAGFADVLVVCGDGERGVPERSPYDRVIATASVHTVPYSWVEQTADGGLLVIPFTGRRHPHGLAVLSVAGGVASGRIVDDNTAFMPLRGQRLSAAELNEIGEPDPVVRIRVGPRGQRVTTQR